MLLVKKLKVNLIVTFQILENTAKFRNGEITPEILIAEKQRVYANNDTSKTHSPERSNLETIYAEAGVGEPHEKSPHLGNKDTEKMKNTKDLSR